MKNVKLEALAEELKVEIVSLTTEDAAAYLDTGDNDYIEPIERGIENARKKISEEDDTIYFLVKVVAEDA